METRKVHISTGILFRTVLLILALWFLYAVRDVIVLLFMAVIIVSAMDPAVDWLQKKKVPRSVSVLGIYIVLFFLIALFFSFLIPPIVFQFQDFSHNFPAYSQRIESLFGPVKDFLQISHINVNAEQLLGSIGSGFSSASRNIFSTTIGVFSGFISTIVVFSLAFYMAAKEHAINHFIVSITPEKHKRYASDLTNRIKEKIGKWMLGQLVLMFIIFLLVTAGLYIAGVPYALILGIFAGIMEVIPYVGPVISAIPGVILGFMVSPATGFFALIVYLISQQFEAHVITPQVMKRAVGLNPIAVILALLVGAKLGGALGAILSIPAATAVSLFIGDLMNMNKNGD